MNIYTVVKKQLPIFLLLLVMFTFLSNSVWSQEPLAPISEKEYMEKIMSIVKKECDAAFDQYNNTTLLTAEDLSENVIPYIAREVVKRSLPLILEKKIHRDHSDNIVLASVNEIPVRVNEIRYEYEKMPQPVKQQMRVFKQFLNYLDDILIVKKLFMKRAKELKLLEKPEIIYQLDVGKSNLLQEYFIRHRQEVTKQNLVGTVTEKEMLDFYRDNLEKLFQIPPRVTLAAVIKRFNPDIKGDKEKARIEIDKAAKDLEEGVTFETVAKKYSDEKKLILGKFRKDEASNDPVIQMGLELLLGKSSDVILGLDGFYIVRAEEIEETRTMPFDAVSANVKLTLVTRKVNEKLEEWVKDLRGSHEIEIFEEELLKDSSIVKPDETSNDTDSKKEVSTTNSKTSLNDVLATIDGTPILREEFNRYIEQIPAKYSKDVFSKEGKLSIINRLIDKKNILEAAKLVEFQYDKKFLAEYEALRQRIISKNLVIMEVAAGIQITDKEVEEYFNQQNEEVKARHILFSVTNKTSAEEETKIIEKAKTVLEKLRSGENFATIAREYSDDPSRIDGGYLGYFTANKMVKEFSDKAFSMKVGEISDLVKTSYGYHIILVEDHRKRTLTPEVRLEIHDQILLPQRQKMAFSKYVEKLKKEAKIVYYEENIRKALEMRILEK
jgi:parvulin-like peptidyl-prolyl isomerase